MIKLSGILLIVAFFIGCGRVETVLDFVPDAENTVFTEDGRLFVSGGKNVYEVKANGDSYRAEAVSPEECNFTGLAVNNNTLYAVCQRKTGFLFFTTTHNLLMASSLSGSVSLSEIHSFNNFSLPNGIDFDAQGRLYVADTAVFSGKIARVNFSSPLKVSSVETWLDRDLGSPNGIRLTDDALYFTDIGALKKVSLNSNGSAGSVSKIYSRLSVLDDFEVQPNGGALVVDFMYGTLFYVTENGEVLGETSSGTFRGPSSVKRGVGPLFSDEVLVVTQKGVIGDMVTGIGNELSIFIPDDDLLDEIKQVVQ